MENKIIISTQFYENYNVGPDGFNTYGDKLPHWKPKGGHEFVIEMDSDYVFYCNDADAIFKKMVEKHNSIAEKFEYIGYEVKFGEPTVLGTKEEFLKINETIQS